MAARPISEIPLKEDYSSKIGLFGWEEIGLVQVPYIVQPINGEEVLYVLVQIAEHQLLQKYLNLLHKDIYSYTFVRSQIISEFEAKLLNKINNKHNDHVYGNESFCVGKDYIVLAKTATLNTSGSWFRIANPSENPYAAVVQTPTMLPPPPPPSLSMPYGTNSCL